VTYRRSPRILITRLSHIGDCILTLPVLNTLRAYFPAAFLTWVVERPADELLWGHEALDRLIVLERGWLKSPRRVFELRRKLRSLGVQIAVDPQSLTKSAVAAWLSGAPRRLGFARGVGRELGPVLNNELVAPRATHVVDRSIELLGALGVGASHLEFRVPEDPVARAKVERYLGETALGNHFAVLNPGAGWSSRRWPPEHYGAVARHLGQVHSLPSLVSWAGDQEREWANQIAASSEGHARVAQPTSLAELASLLARAQLFVGSDTGPMHLAAAMGTPCVALHGTTKPSDSGPYGPRHIALQAYYQGGTSRQRRRAHNEAMRAITPDAVAAACTQILGHTSHHRPTYAA
jgi:ADP-heptose:LPS heptosyltransferase